MKNLLLIFFIIFGLIACENESSSLEDDSDIDLDIELSVLTNDGDNVSSSIAFAIKLIELRTNNETGKTSKIPIEVVAPDKLELELGGEIYDLSDRYLPLSIYPNSQSYVISMPATAQNLENAKISFSFKGNVFSASFVIPQPLNITSSNLVIDSFNPVSDDIFIEWTQANIETQLEINQRLSYKTGYCLNRVENMLPPSNEHSQSIFSNELTQNCKNNADNVQSISTHVSLKNTPEVLLTNQVGFKSVYINAESSYFWAQNIRPQN